jgi:predicted RNA-binding protein with PIN domain
VLEAALAVARAGERADPPVPAPAAVRRYLSFQRFPERAAESVRRALEEDDGFRLRVREAVVAGAPPGEPPEAAVGEAGWLLLDRPADGEARLEALLEAAAVAAAAERQERDDRRAGKRLARAEAQLDEARAAAGAAAGREAEVREALDGELARARALQAALEAERQRSARLAGERAEAVRQLEEARRRLHDRAEERRSLRARAVELQAEVDALRAEVARAAAAPAGSGATTGARDRPDGNPAPAGEDGPAVGGAGTTAGADPAFGAEERRALAEAMGDAAAAVAALGAALERAGAVVGPPVDRGDGGAPAADRRAATGGGDDLAGATDRPPPLRRLPARLPVGMFDDGVEAAAFLVRLPGAVLVVDGYNVSMAGWSDQPLAQQRRRLVDALRNLQARTGVEPVVVFDGAEVDSGPTGSLPRSVQVRFSPPGVIADDVVVELVDRYPTDRAVVVATSDRELQGRVAGLGANTVSSGQMVELLRR